MYRMEFSWATWEHATRLFELAVCSKVWYGQLLGLSFPWPGRKGVCRASPASISWDRWHSTAFLSGAIWVRVESGRRDSLSYRGPQWWSGAPTCSVYHVSSTLTSIRHTKLQVSLLNIWPNFRRGAFIVIFYIHLTTALRIGQTGNVWELFFKDLVTESFWSPGEKILWRYKNLCLPCSHALDSHRDMG